MFQSIGKAFSKMVNRFTNRKQKEKLRVQESIPEPEERKTSFIERTTRKSKAYKPAWWVKLFGTRQKPKGLSLHLQPIRPFGNFRKIKPFQFTRGSRTPKTWNKNGIKLANGQIVNHDTSQAKQ